MFFITFPKIYCMVGYIIVFFFGSKIFTFLSKVYIDKKNVLHFFFFCSKIFFFGCFFFFFFFLRLAFGSNGTAPLGVKNAKISKSKVCVGVRFQSVTLALVGIVLRKAFPHFLAKINGLIRI